MSPRTKRAYEQIREDRKEQITAAARTVFANKGFGATVIDDIAAAANISKGLIYHYFSSKEEIFIALVQQAMEGAQSLIREALSRPDSPWNRLHWLTTEVMTRAQDDPEAYAIIVQAYTSQAVPQTVREMVVQYIMTSAQAIRELVVAGQAAGQVVEHNPDELAVTFTACLQGLALSVSAPVQQNISLPDANIVLRMLAVNAA